METICLDTTHEDSDCSIITVKRKLPKADVVLIESDESETESPPKRKRTKRNDTKRIAPTVRITRSLTQSNLITVEIDTKPEKTIDNKTKVQPKKPQLITKTEPKKVSTNNFKTKTEPKKVPTNDFNTRKNDFYEQELLAEKAKLSINTARNIIEMFEAGNTIPFMARYRKHLTNEMSPEKLREVKDSYEEICSLKARSTTVLKAIEKCGKLTDDLRNCILNCRNLSELEHIYDPFKSGNKKTLAGRAKLLGLEPPALDFLTGAKDVDPKSLINKNTDGLRTPEEVERGLMHIMAHVISTDTEVIKFIRSLQQQINLTIETKKSTSIAKNVKEADANKFQNYFNYHISVHHIKPHQVLAINRGEHLKILSVKFNIPDYVFKQFKYFCEQKWLNGTYKSNTRMRVLQETFKDCYKRLIAPLIIRQSRSGLKTTAEKASIDVFTLNLKKLLLGTPLKGQQIMGIDPGFQQGCKLAIVSSLGEVLDTGVIYPHTKNLYINKEIVKQLLLKYECSLIALGNGTACRETETWLADLIKTNFFKPLDVRYTIIDEAGASIYSCSPEAKKEFPDLDALLVSAVSLARRLQDPLAELVKVEPKHLGVGMYQHDLNKKALETALDEVVTECVSFVGVNLNTASHCILRKVAGLSAQRAENILNHRSTIGSFTNRYQLKDVKGIGDKIFEQCAGFLRVGPMNYLQAREFYGKPDTMPLDCTWIHPESYSLAENIIRKFNLNYKQIGEPEFITQFKEFVQKTTITDLAKEFNNTEATVKLIIDVLSRQLDHDLRQENPQEPLFRKGVISINDIKENMVLTGRVTNVTQFGAFVDIGVGRNGLIHKSEMNGFDVQLGNRVEVKVLNIDIKRGRIGLKTINKL